MRTRRIISVRHGTEQYAIDFGHARHHGCGQGRPLVGEAGKADFHRLERQPEREHSVCSLKDVERRPSYFRTDTVTGQDENVHTRSNPDDGIDYLKT